MSLYRDDGVVLRVQKLGEADRIITILTRRTGRVRAVAKGVRRTKSKFGAGLEPFSHVDCLLYAGRELDIVTQAEIVSPFGSDIVTDYGRYTAGTAMLETAERLTAEEREPSMQAVPAPGRRSAVAQPRVRTSPYSCSMPLSCGLWRSRATSRHSTRAPGAASRGRTATSRPRPAAWSVPGAARRVR